MSKHIRVYWLTCVLMIAAIQAGATTIVMPTDEQLIDKSPVVVEATVKSSAPVMLGGGIFTETHLIVTEALKGNVAGEIVVREIGGELDGRITKIFGTPIYTAGQRVLAFLTRTPRGDYQTIDLFAGKFTDREMLNGDRFWTRDAEANDVSLLDADLHPLPPAKTQRRAEAFSQFVAERASGHSKARNYEVENPVPALEEQSITAQFTLISEPTVYRWATFDNGGSARWLSYGSQGGYSGGGVSEVQTAMASWNNYSGAKISYRYGGTTTTHGGNNAPNGTNEVLFEDPNQEIAGAWNGRGGVVGLGGFNGISGSANWTASFTADASHAAGTYRAYNITEGNFVVQDGVSAATGIPSATLAEIAAHELGHTLGFGHSADSTALMYATVSGRGPSLRADDQLAARWLYPSGSGTTTPPPVATAPAAPSNLSATASGTSVRLQWSDNATTETGQSVYVAQGSGAFSKATDVAANVTTTNLSGFTAGSYRFYVTAFNSVGSSTTSNVANATIGSTAGVVTAAFSVSTANGTAGQTSFSFIDQTTGGTIASRVWNFGDGQTSTTANPTHVYANAGNYTVTLVITSTGGAQSSATRNISVVAASAPLNASFSYAPLDPIAGQDVVFTDGTTGGATSWAWSFGDGTTSAAQNPIRRFAKAGTYHVALTATKSGSSSSSAIDLVVNASIPATPAVSAAFSVSPSTASVGDVISFFDQSSGSPSSWSWNFGDGATSSQQNPTHVFAARGAYLVTLTASNGSSSASASHQVTINADTTFRSLVSVTAQTNGIGGSVWRTELTLFNAGDEGLSVHAIYLATAGTAPVTRSFFLAPRQVAAYNNALLDIFGIGSGAGAIAIEATGANETPQLKIASRTFTTGSTGTYGQAVPDVHADGLQQTLYVTGLATSVDYRTNIGLVNRANAPVSATLALLDADGRTIGQTDVSVGANSFQQSSLQAFFPSLGTRAYEVMSMRVIAGAQDALSAYASVIDNRTQDPVYVQATPVSAGSEVVIPAVGRVPGANGTFWRSDVTLFNPTNAFLNIDVRYLASGSDNRGAVVRALSIAPNKTLVLADVLAWLGMTSGSGALDIRWSGSAGPIVTSRTYTSTVGGGTYGQSIDAAPMGDFTRDAWVTGLRADASFRSNAGFVNGSDSTIGVSVALIANGQQLATAFVQLAPRGQLQYSMPALFPGINANTIGSFTIEAHTDSPSLLVYGSIVDNVSGDPVFFAGE
ncbi:MAG: cell surface protein [Acidobacteria bacterium]|nr:cell surface protein [Acidobacteriota bacterium]